MFRKSLAAVKRDAIVSSLRKQQLNPRRHVNGVNNAVDSAEKAGISSLSCACKDRKGVFTPRVVSLPEGELPESPGGPGSGRSGQEAVGSTPPFLHSNLTRKCTATRVANPRCSCSALPVNFNVPACAMKQHHQGRPAVAFTSGSARVGSPVAAVGPATRRSAHVGRSEWREIPGTDSYVQSETAPVFCSSGGPAAVSTTPTGIRDWQSGTPTKMPGDGSATHRGGDNTPDERREEGSMERRRPSRMRTPTTDILRRLLYESTPIPRDGYDGEGEEMRRSTPEARRNPVSGGFRRRLFDGDADGHGAATIAPPPPITDCSVDGRVRRDLAVVQTNCSARKHENGAGGGGRIGDSDGPLGVNETRNEEAVRGRRQLLKEGRTEYAVACEADSEYVTEKDGASGTRGRMLGYTGGRETFTGMQAVPKNDQDLRERLLQARRNFSALRSGISTDEL